MNDENTSVVFSFRQDNSIIEEVEVEVSELRKLLENAKLNKDVQDVQFKIETDNNIITQVMKVSELRKIIKQAELQKRIVPRHFSNYFLDLTRVLSKKEREPIKGRESEIEKIWFYLSQKKRNNVFLIGDADVGKTAIAIEIARQLATSECPKEFYDTRMLMLKPEMFSRIKSDFIYEHVINKLLKFLVEHKEEIILYIDKALYMKTDVYLIEMLNQVICSYHIPVILTIDVDDFETYFLKDVQISKYLNYILVKEPELEELEPMIQGKISKLQKKYDIKISNEMIKFGIFTSVLSNSVSSNPGNVINVFERAFLEAKRKEKESIDKQSILSCYDSYWKLYNNMAEEEKRQIAYHEAGHYVVTIMCNNIKDQKIAFVSILPMMDFLGVNWPYKILGKTLNYTKDYFLDNIAIYMAGRIAEKLVTAKDSTGASSDLSEANTIAENMIIMYGFSANPNNANRSYITRNFELKDYLMHEEKKSVIDNEIQQLVDEGYKIAENIINDNKKLVEMIAEKLLEEEILTQGELLQIVEEYKKNK